MHGVGKKMKLVSVIIPKTPREDIKMNYGYIYKTTNLLNKKIYIGQNKGSLNSNYYGSGVAVKNAIMKYGKRNFRLQILCWTSNAESLDRKERCYIKAYRKLFGNDGLYNMSSGGEHGKNSGDSRFKKGFIPWNKGKHICLNTGRTHLKKGQTVGKRFGIEVDINGKNNFFFGKKHSPRVTRIIKKTWFKKGGVPWNKGIKRPEISGENHWKHKKKLLA